MAHQDWNQNEKYVLAELKRISDTLEKIRIEIAAIHIENVKLTTEHKTTATIYGFLGSLVVGLGGVIWEVMRSK